MSENSDCIFCRIIKGELPAEILYQDDEVVCIRDINPIAPVHLLVIPRAHIEYVSDLTEADFAGLSHTDKEKDDYHLEMKGEGWEFKDVKSSGEKGKKADKKPKVVGNGLGSLESIKDQLPAGGE